MKNNFLISLLGSKYKSDVIIDLLPTWIKNNPDGEIIVFDPQGYVKSYFQDDIDYLIQPNNDFKWLNYLLEKYNTSDKKDVPKLLILNGGNILFPKPKKDTIVELNDNKKLKKLPLRPLLPKKFADLLCLRRYLNMDIIITFQDPEGMPMVLERFVTDFIILPILSEYEPDKRSPNYFNIETCIKTINDYRENYSKNPTKEYLRINVDKNEIIAIDSIDKKKFKKIINKYKRIRKKVCIL